jgi:transposase-like protein
MRRRHHDGRSAEDDCSLGRFWRASTVISFAKAIAVVAPELMEAEISVEVGAELGEVCSDRTGHRNGYRPRPWETRVGEIELLIPRKRQGPAYFPSFLEPRRRSEQAIVAVVLEAYVNGVSTRKVDRLVEQLGIAGMSKDRVSALCRALDEAGPCVPRAPIERRISYLWLDPSMAPSPRTYAAKNRGIRCQRISDSGH